jgi:hypothetical protein
MINRMVSRHPDDRLTSDPDQYTYPVYVVPASQPLVPVKTTYSHRYARSDGSVATDQGNTTPRVPLPPEARPAAGADSQIIVVQGNDEWNLFAASRAADGSWSATSANRYMHTLSGVVDRATGQAWPNRGAGIPYLAGLVRPAELEAGVIRHALAFAFNAPRKGVFVSPASKTDGLDDHPDAIPEGARLQLDPSFDVNSLTHPYARVIARALIDYGMIVVDNSGSPKVMLEYRGTAGWGADVTRALVSEIPLSRFRVLQLPPAQTG